MVTVYELMKFIRNSKIAFQFEDTCQIMYTKVLYNYHLCVKNALKGPFYEIFEHNLQTCLKLVGSSVAAYRLDDLTTVCSSQVSKDFARFFAEDVEKLSMPDFYNAVEKFEDLRDSFVTAWKQYAFDTLEAYQKDAFAPDAAEFTGGLFLRSVDNLHKEYLDIGHNNGFVSATYTTTENPHWYLEKHRSILLIYDVPNTQKLHLIGMSKWDATSFALRRQVNGNQELLEGYLFFKLLFDGFLPANLTLGMNSSVFYPAVLPKDLEEDNEIILDSDAEPCAIVVTDNYKEELFNSDLAGVWAYSKYANLPIYLLGDGKITKVDEIA